MSPPNGVRRQTRAVDFAGARASTLDDDGGRLDDETTEVFVGLPETPACRNDPDLRHTFGSLLIQSGAVVYVKEQMGHSSIQVTVDTYGHLIRGANVSFVDKLDELPKQEEKTTLHQSAPGTHQAQNEGERKPQKLLI